MRRQLNLNKPIWSDSDLPMLNLDAGAENIFQSPELNSKMNEETVAEENKQFKLNLLAKQNEIDLSKARRPELQSAFANTYTGNIGSSGGSGSYLSNLADVESGDNWNALNQGSKAFGKFQFIPSTEKAYASKLGISIDQARTPEGQMAMVSAFTNDNKNGLIKAGFEPTQKNLYMAHQQGLGGALTMLKGGQASQRNLQGNGVSNTAEWIAKFAPRFA